MTWIRLTFSNDGTQFDCNAERIALMYPPTEMRAGTSVYFGGGDVDYVSVKETPEQILKLIGKQPDVKEMRSIFEQVFGKHPDLV